MKELRVPKLALGDGDQMIVLDWLVEPGAGFSEGDILLEVETDKATMEVDAPFDGVLAKALCEAGQAVTPGELIAWIADPGEDYDPEALAGEGADGEPAPTDRVPADRVSRTNEGAVTVELAERRRATAWAVEHGELRGLPETARQPAAGAPSAEVLSLEPETVGSFETVAFTRHRSAVARSMTASAAIPQFAVYRQLDLAPVGEALATLRESVPAATLTDVLLLCVARALGEVPAVNAWCDGSTVHRFADANIALAVDGPEGVIAPVIRGAQGLDLAGLAEERRRVVGLAREGRVASADLAGATFSVSNIGPLGAHGLLPLLTPPQVAILALGAARPGDAGNQLTTATLAGDHRAIDGADGARFLTALAGASAALAGPA
jgi:pyruvate dehydrogenase E2 component (dihydrolipoamide acetyltransferase)